ncbi:hypothetical protein BGZ76_011066 [Entomortierella beljakovae]|nr:hypothetical protein BGZ76_011066 [Entomortierella beljakovae]
MSIGSTQAPHVLIAGGGIGGLFLAILLERIDIPYHIIERATELRALGAAMSLTASVFPVFEQLGLLDELMKISFDFGTVELYRGNMTKFGSNDLTHLKETAGYNSVLFARPKLYELLLRQVPPSKISRGKKILRHTEKDGKVTIHCSDNTTYQGDILVGADGAYSGVRQCLYKLMDEQNILPKSDLDSFSIGTVLMVGVANPENPEKYPDLKSKTSKFCTIIGPNNRNWSAVTTPDNQICWSIAVLLSGSEARDQHFRNSEWGAESNETLIQESRDYLCPLGGTMGDLIDATPKHLISKVFLEEKLFKTWYHGRTVLIGDACHKMLPAGGFGAVNAMHDAVVLANCLYNMCDSTTNSITDAFKEYYQQRYSRAQFYVDRSSDMNKLFFGQKLFDRFLRHVFFNYIPNSILKNEAAKSFFYRPQLAWLPLVKKPGTSTVLPQEGKRIDNDR